MIDFSWNKRQEREPLAIVQSLLLSPIPSPAQKLDFSIILMCTCQLSASWHKDIAG